MSDAKTYAKGYRKLADKCFNHAIYFITAKPFYSEFANDRAASNAFHAAFGYLEMALRYEGKTV